MFKKILLLLISLAVIPAFAGELESALMEGKDVFLYLYTPKCKYCNDFSPIYNKIKFSNRDFAFYKINANTEYGNTLMRTFKGYYVPYVLLMNQNKKIVIRLTPSCVLDEKCILKEMEDYKKIK